MLPLKIDSTCDGLQFNCLIVLVTRSNSQPAAYRCSFFLLSFIGQNFIVEQHIRSSVIPTIQKNFVERRTK
ncbi:hypothetical protein HUJ04_010031 [Dendroctonus ponderosae]|nr:hypothetical protein HUJ04_010031 [Dendroctonus ponderosae]